MKYRKAIKLLKKFISGKASDEEKAAIDKWYEKFDETAINKNIETTTSTEVKEKIYQNILSGIQHQTPVIPFYKKISFKITAAAAIILFFVGIYFLWTSNHSNEKNIAVIKLPVQNDVAPPTSNKAILTLADGTKINIDSAGKGVVAKQGNIDVEKRGDGQLVYNGKAEDEISYNTLSVPRGSTPITLKLADGTDVWVNVASSITYPTAFVGPERKVIITGEAYFEVKKNALMPFIVKQANKDVEVRVLGTHFNINTYDDEDFMKITLLEGKVDVSANRNHLLLEPGEQAQVNSFILKKSSDININEVVAWKNGTFYFDGADVKTIMRQVEKWYNVEIIYQDNINYSFVAKISRDVNASQLFKILELTDLVHFKIEGNKITVMK